MTDNDLRKDNELIAEFIRMPKVADHYESLKAFELYKPDELRFALSWDWLMPVYRKFKDVLRELHKNMPPNTACQGDLIEVDIHCAVNEVDIQKAHFYLTQGIKWYNEQNKS